MKLWWGLYRRRRAWPHWVCITTLPVWRRRRQGAADRAGALTAAVAARAVMAECAARTGDVAGALALLPAAGEELPGGLAGALVKRARAIRGDDDALMALRVAADVLRAPGLLVGLRA